MSSRSVASQFDITVNNSQLAVWNRFIF